VNGRSKGLKKGGQSRPKKEISSGDRGKKPSNKAINGGDESFLQTRKRKNKKNDAVRRESVRTARTGHRGTIPRRTIKSGPFSLRVALRKKKSTLEGGGGHGRKLT